MARRKISQAEAWGMWHQLKAMKEADQLRRNAYAREYPGGIHLGTIVLTEVQSAKLTTARKLDHVLVGTTINTGQLEIYAVRH